MSRSLYTALLKLHGHTTLAASQFTPAQRQALDLFARQTKAVACRQQGNGYVYHISDQQIFHAHLISYAPQTGADMAVDGNMPLRAKNIIRSRNSKGHHHRLNYYYPIVKAVGHSVYWYNIEEEKKLPLSQLTQVFGSASLSIKEEDAWHTDKPLWLVENQTLFDDTQWLPENTQATLLYYGGELDGRLISWLAHRPRASRIILFADYDGVGLSNFARLYQLLGESCHFWLMPDWQQKLERYGNREIWQNNFDRFINASTQLPDYLKPLIEHMRHFALALEQEAVWAPIL